MDFYLRTDEETEWTLLATEIASMNQAKFIWDTSSVKDGQYYIKAVARDAAGNENSNLFQRRYQVDNTGIGKITIKEHSVFASMIRLEWEDVKESDFAYFAVEHKVEEHNATSGQAIWKEINKITDRLGIDITNLKPDTQYTFRVVGYDNLGNRGVCSDEITLTTASDDAPPSIIRIDPCMSKYNDIIELKITATDNDVVKKGVFSYSTDGKEFVVLAEDESGTTGRETFTYKWNVTDLPGGDVTVRFEVYDEAGWHNRLLENDKQVEAVYTIDHTAPLKPTDLEITYADGSIGIQWAEAKEKDIKHYCIYRSDTIDGDYAKIGEINAKNYYDTSVEPSCTYYYKIAAVDISGNASEWSDAIKAVVLPDTTNPVITGIAPSDGTILGIKSTLSLIAYDNSIVDRVRIEYREKDSDTMWIAISTQDVKQRDAYITFDWNTDGLKEETIYEIRAIATDKAGNESEPVKKEYTLDLTAPKTPELSAQTNSFKISLSYGTYKEAEDEEAEEEVLYEIWRKAYGENDYQRIHTTTLTEYEDESVETEKIYYYKVKAYDIYDNCAESAVVYSHASSEDTIAPVAQLPQTMMATNGSLEMYDGTASTDNVRITSYTWDFGDGTKATGAKQTHNYNRVGTYTITLSVADAEGNIDTTYSTVVVKDKEESGHTVVTVKGSDGLPIAGADVYVNMDGSEQGTIRCKTNSLGEATIVAENGTYDVAAFAEGYLPSQEEVEFAQGEERKVDIILKSGEIVTGELTFERMELDDMIAAGVDLSAPENYHTFIYSVNLSYVELPIPEIYEGQVSCAPSGRNDWTSHGFKGCSLEPGDGRFYTQVIFKEESGQELIPVTLIHMSVVQSVSWLKDMYNVQLNITNNADSGFRLEQASATIDLPEGLSLAKLESGQSKTEQFGTIDGQESASVSWIVRGDKTGSFPIKAVFNANMMPFNVPIVKEFVSEKEIEVPAGRGLEIKVCPENAAFWGETYYIKFVIKNNSDHPFYNLRTSFADKSGNGLRRNRINAVNPETCENEEYTVVADGVDYRLPDGNTGNTSFAVESGDGIIIGVFMPGEEIESYYYGAISPSDEEHYLALVDAFVDNIKGENLGVKVTVSPMSSHVPMRYKYITENESEEYGDPVDVTTGAFKQELLAFHGGDTNLMDLVYDSVEAQSHHDMGYGWSHSFDQYIEEKDGKVILHLGNGKKVTYVSEIDRNKLVRGVMIENNPGERAQFNVSKATRCEANGVGNYVPEDIYGGNMSIRKNKAGSEYAYEYTDANETTWYFDEAGKVVKRKTKEGYEYTYMRENDLLCIVDEYTGKNMLIYYSDGKIVEVCDAAGRKIQLNYNEAGDLTEYTDEEGKITRFEYDENHHLCRGISPTDVLLFENTFDEEGRVLTQVEAGSELKSKFSYKKLSEKTASTTITKRDGNQLSYTYDQSGNILSETNELGETTTYRYDNVGNILQRVTPGGHKTTYTYDETGQLVKSVDPVGNTVSYEYDDKGNPIVIKGADESNGTYEYDDKDRLTKAISVLGQEKVYEYDKYGNPTKETITELGSKTYKYMYGKKVSETDRLGNKLEYKYDQFDNMEEVSDSLGTHSKSIYDEMGRVIQSTDVLGTTTVYKYDPLGRLITEDTEGRVTMYAYDDADRVISMTNPKGGKTEYTYDTEGNTLSVRYPDGTMTQYEYDALGRVIKTKLPDKTIDSYEYNKDGWLKSETIAGQKTSYTYYGNGKIKTVTYPDGQTDSYTYDKNGYVSTVTDEEGNVTTYHYDAAGNMTKVTDALNYSVTYTYDKHGRVIKVTDANNNTESYVYDANGNCIRKTNAEGTVFHMKYDILGRLTSISVSVGEETLTNTYTYNEAGQVTSVTDAEGNTTTATYDAYGNLMQVSDSTGTMTYAEYDALDRLILQEDASGECTYYEYDKANNIISVRNTGDNSQEYRYKYDELGRMVACKDPEGGIVKASYTQSGQVQTITDPNGGVTEYIYDELDRISEVISAIGSTQKYTYNAQGLLSEEQNAKGQKTRYTYDAIGRIKTKSDESGTIRYSYDANGNILKVEEKQGLSTKTIVRTFDAMNRVTSVTDSNGKTIKYGYDELGNRISLTYPGGEIVRYTYDKCGRMLTVTDIAGNVTRYEYDKRGNLTKQIRPDGSIETRQYDALGNLKQQRDVAADQSEIHTFTYTYDSNGNIIEKTGESTGDLTLLTSAVMNYDEDNRLITYNGEPVTYDADGNMLHGPLNGEMADFTYDCRNRLVKIVTADGETTSYTYDAENVRLSSQSEKTQITYVTDREATYSQVLMEQTEEIGLFGITNETGRKTYTYGIGLLSEHQSGTDRTRYYHYNNIGSTTEITEQDGTVSYRFSYGVYGELLGVEGDTEEADVTYLYNGEYGIQTEKNGLYYMRARYYNPDIKRFINRDIIDGDIANSQSLNKYSYVQGNPVSLTDPFGLCPEEKPNRLAHAILDGLGLIFDGADLGNALLYFLEGDIKNALISAACMLPFIGSAIYGVAKGTKALIKAGSKLTSGNALVKLVSKHGDEIIQGAKGYTKQANKYKSSFSQKAAKAYQKASNAANAASDAGKAAAKAATKAGTNAASDAASTAAAVARKSDYAKASTKASGSGYKSGSKGVKTDFYVKPDGDVIPATGYRYMPKDASYLNSLQNTMEIPANPSGTYITFDKFDVPAPGRLQVPHDASIRGSFDTLQIIDDIRVPNGKWGQASWLEPITKDFPKYGSGGATQAITYQKIKLNELKYLLQ